MWIGDELVNDVEAVDVFDAWERDEMRNVSLLFIDGYGMCRGSFSLSFYVCSTMIYLFRFEKRKEGS